MKTIQRPNYYFILKVNSQQEKMKKKRNINIKWKKKTWELCFAFS